MGNNEPKKKLVGPWRSIHGAIWLIGLGILLWKGWIWPGILILIALSTIIEVVIMKMVPDSFEVEEPLPPIPPIAPAGPAAPTHPSVMSTVVETPVVHHAENLPTNCPKCGAPTRGHDVKWTSANSADCSFCGANLPMSK